MKIDARSVEAGNNVAREASLVAAARKESILAFAQRHGWEVSDSDTTDYFTDVRVSKANAFVDLTLWPGLRKDIAAAKTHTGEVAVKVPDPVRARVEKFLVGVECRCVPEPEWLNATSEYEGRPFEGCPVHGWSV